MLNNMSCNVESDAADGDDVSYDLTSNAADHKPILYGTAFSPSDFARMLDGGDETVEKVNALRMLASKKGLPPEIYEEMDPKVSKIAKTALDRIRVLYPNHPAFRPSKAALKLANAGNRLKIG